VDSILTSVKKTLNLDEDYTFYDPEITLHINSVFSTLTQLGVGPSIGFEIEDKTATWDNFLEGNLQYSFIKSYFFLRVRLLFDPPTTSYTLDSFDKQLKELEWRINVVRETTAWIPGTPALLPGDEELILDGGGP
jgi:hypothetical protein